jgi:hypothetical protein
MENKIFEAPKSPPAGGDLKNFIMKENSSYKRTSEASPSGRLEGPSNSFLRSNKLMAIFLKSIQTPNQNKIASTFLFLIPYFLFLISYFASSGFSSAATVVFSASVTVLLALPARRVFFTAASSFVPIPLP